MDLRQEKARFLTPRILLVGFSFVSLVICILSGAAHYRKVAGWGDLWHPIGWLLSMAFLVFAFLPGQRDLTAGFKSLVKPKTAVLLFWILFFVVWHLWNFRTAPWNGNGLFDESGWDLWFLKHFVIGHPYQAAWFHVPISRETLFHYYVLGFFRLFGFNILSYEAALFFIWFAIYFFALLLVDLFFESYIVTSLTALIFNFLPYAFIYTFVGYRYPMATAFAVISLYFLHLGFRQISPLCLSLGGIAAGLCLASSISGKQYLLALVVCAPLYAAFHRRSLTQPATWTSLAVVVYGFVAAAAPILLYIAFNRENYTLYESGFLRAFWQAAHVAPFPAGIRLYIQQLSDCFFTVPGPRFLIPDTLPIPLPYYWLLVPGMALGLWWKRFEIVFLAIIPVAGAFVATSWENRLLLAIPFWVILMAFTFAGVLNLKRWPGVQILLGAMSGLVLLTGLSPSVEYIYGKMRSPSSVLYYAQAEVAVSRFLRHVVGGQERPGLPHLERNEFNRLEKTLDAPYDTLVCAQEAYSIIHLFLHDYDDSRTLSFCGGSPMYVMSQPDIWRHNKTAILSYAPTNKDLKLIWENDGKTERILNLFEPLHDLAAKESISFAFSGKQKTFYVLNIASKNIRQFQARVRALPDFPP